MLEHDVLVLATYQCSSRGYAGAGGGTSHYMRQGNVLWSGAEESTRVGGTRAGGRRGVAGRASRHLVGGRETETMTT